MNAIFDKRKKKKTGRFGEIVQIKELMFYSIRGSKYNKEQCSHSIMVVLDDRYTRLGSTNATKFDNEMLTNEQTTQASV